MSIIKIEDADVFFNWLYFKNKIEKLLKDATIILNLDNIKLFNCSFKENILNLKNEFFNTILARSPHLL